MKEMKKIPRKSGIISISILSVIIFFGLQSPLFVSAQNISQLRSEIDTRNADIDKLEAEIASYQKQLDVIGKEADTLTSQIKKLDLTRAKLNIDIKVTQNKIEATNLTIQKLSLQINDKETTIGDNKQAISSSLKKISEFDQATIIESILSKDTISDAWNEIENLKTFQDKVRSSTEELKDAKKDLEDNKKETEAAKQKLVNLKNELADQKTIVDQNTKEKNKLLSDTKNQESSYKTLIADRLARKQALEKEIRDYESQLTFILDPNTLPRPGVLNWPLDNIFITQLFGATVDAKRLYVSGTHNGVDFKASMGTPVKAMLAGTVVGTGNTDITCPGASFGKWVLVKFNNGLAATYGHLSLIKVGEGDRVYAGQVIGYSGNTGYSTGPHLHVSVYAANAVQVKNMPSKACGGRIYTLPVAPINAYLDPMVYLPPYRH